MKKNRIPRTAKKISVRYTIPGYEHMICTKGNGGWHGVEDNGTTWFVPESHLRNGEICKLEVIE